MFSALKTIKPLHWLYNLLHYRQLLHNKEAFKSMGINRPLFSSLSSKNFPDKRSKAWLDMGDSSVLVESSDGFDRFAPAVQESLRAWSSNGYLILPGFFEAAVIDSINAEINAMQTTGKLKFENGNKLMFANQKSKLIKDVTSHTLLLELLGFILGKDIVPFQTINFITGSGQRAHSDSIHMTTYPLGYLIAVWIALEDVSTENGPLFYYPGSHQLPYVLNDDFNQSESAIFTGNKEYADYEDVIEKKVIDGGFEKKVFHAKKGDVFIWHANLIHGGSPVLNPSLTRKSMVIHYFAKNVVKYHEITERPSLLK